MKKILIFSLAYHPHVGGAEVAIQELTDRIADIEWHLITMRFSAADAAEEKVGNVQVHRVGRGSSYISKILFVPRAAHCAARLHAELKFGALWAMMTYMLLPVLFANLRLPYALSLQEGDTQEHVFGRLRILPFLPFIKRGFRRATVVQAISTYLGEWARMQGYKGKLVIIPNGADTKRFAKAIPAKVDRQAGDVFLVTTSRLVHKNAVDDIICALALCPPHVKLLIAGSGQSEEALRALAARAGLAARVRFLGHVGHEAVPHLLRACDIFVRPSRSEGMGNSFIEAMAAGLPVIATREGGLNDFITAEVAWPVPKDSPPKIAEAIEEILRNPAHTKEVISRAKELATNKYDWDLLAQDMREKVFAAVLR